MKSYGNRLFSIIAGRDQLKLKPASRSISPFAFVGRVISAATRRSREAKLLLESGLFDLQFYSSQVESGRNPSVADFLNKGWKRGANPSPYFDSKFYLQSNPDVQNGGWNPIIHYIRHGWKEGRKPHPRFDSTKYIAEHSHVDFKTMDPLQHCIRTYGSIDWIPITTQPSHVTGPRLTADEQLSFDRLFDRDYYNSMYEDVRRSNMDPVVHYTIHGWRENRNPSPEIDTWYMKHQAEFVDGHESPLHQYVRAGMPRTWAIRSCNSITLDVAAALENNNEKLSLAVHVHAFYPEFIEDTYHALNGLRTSLDLFVTTCSLANERFIFHYLTRRNPTFKFKVRSVENRGRDIGPMLSTFPEIWSNYDIVAHLHSKKSLHTDFGEHWRQHCLDQMFGSAELVEHIMNFLKENEDVGFFYPDNFWLIKKHMDSDRNAQLMATILRRAQIRGTERSKVPEFAAGSMAWYRTAAFRPLVNVFSSAEDFDLEEGQIDGTVAHAMEHVFPLVATGQGYRAICYYLKRPVRLTHFDRCHVSTSVPHAQGRRWMRDDPKIAAQPRLPLKPTSHVFDARKLDIHWVVPYFGRGAGGHMTIFRFVELLERFGHRQTLWIQNAASSAEDAAVRIRHWYRPIGDNVVVRTLQDDTRGMAGDVIIATDCWTVYPIVSATNFKERFYFIQDFEPYFHPIGDNYLIAEQTYRMGLCGLCAGDWLAGKMQEFGMWVRKWDLAVDEEFYFLDANSEADYSKGREICIAYYARSYTPRRATRLGIAAFEELQRRGLRFRVIMFGEETTDKANFTFNHEDRGILHPEQLAQVYHSSHVGVVFSTTNYSLVPLEMMACDLPVVEIDGESTRTIFKNNEVTFAVPDPSQIADAIERLLNDAERRMRQKQSARRFVHSLTWERSVRAVEAAILDRLDERGFQAINAEQVCMPALGRKPRVSVFVPTYNAGQKFSAVLSRLAEQTTSFVYDVLVIDSGSTDETIDIVRSFNSRNIRLLEIPNSEFQHGRTRNLGVASTDGDYVAIITQDAMPYDHGWLEKLVGGFSISPRVGGVIGRHKAYPEHGPFVARDIDALFDRIADFGPLFCLDDGLPSYINVGSVLWQMSLQFYSDNNSAIARSVWKSLPYPEVDWGEDQVWAWEMLRAGFHKGYVDDATVFHSHQYTPQQRYDVAFKEGTLFARHFGWNFHPDSYRHQSEIETLNNRDLQFALANRVPFNLLKAQQKLNRAMVRGRSRGAIMESERW